MRVFYIIVYFSKLIQLKDREISVCVCVCVLGCRGSYVQPLCLTETSVWFTNLTNSQIKCI